MRVYAVGGTGVNIASQYVYNNLNVDVVYIDSSEANVRKLKGGDVYLLEGVNGAGKNRSISHTAFREVASDILIQYPPSSKVNIIVTSMSGGTGSACSITLVKELLEGGHPVVVVAVEAYNSVLSITNTINAYKSFKGLSNMLDQPVAIYPITEQVRSAADKEAVSFISVMQLLVEETLTEEFDHEDLNSFLRYNTVTGNPADVGFLRLYPSLGHDTVKGVRTVGTILMTKDSDAILEEPIPDYDSICVLNDGQEDVSLVRIDLELGEFATTIEELQAKVKELNDNAQLSKIKTVDVKPTEGEDFMVL